MRNQYHGLAVLASLASAGFLDDAQQPLARAATAEIPQIGYGTWQLHNATEAVAIALEVGYEHLDCAAAYDNEKAVGKGIQDGLARSGKKREDIWITSKLFNTDHGYENVGPAIERTLADLGLEYLDLYLMHWPEASKDGVHKIEFMDTWRGMERLVALGKTRYIGIANFDLYQLAHIQLHAHIKPAVHQFEGHPYLQQSEFVKFNHALGIQVTAYSPLANLNPYYDDTGRGVPTLLENEIITGIARQRGCTNAQVALAWGMKRGTSVIPKSQHADRIKENLDSLKCELRDDDMRGIEEISRHLVKRFNDPSKQDNLKLFQGLEDSVI